MHEPIDYTVRGYRGRLVSCRDSSRNRRCFGVHAGLRAMTLVTLQCASVRCCTHARRRHMSNEQQRNLVTEIGRFPAAICILLSKIGPCHVLVTQDRCFGFRRMKQDVWELSKSVCSNVQACKFAQCLVMAFPVVIFRCFAWNDVWAEIGLFETVYTVICAWSAA